jgi:hypothetical protein
VSRAKSENVRPARRLTIEATIQLDALAVFATGLYSRSEPERTIHTKDTP